MKIKSPTKRGKRTVCVCQNCGEEFSELNIKINAGGGKFCCNDCYKTYRKEHAKDTKELNRLYQKKNKYNLTKEEYYALFDKQGNKCAICGCEFSKEKRGYVDHNHLTKTVRGLLCNRCNFLIGVAHEDVTILQKAIEYLIRKREISEQKQNGSIA